MSSIDDQIIELEGLVRSKNPSPQAIMQLARLYMRTQRAHHARILLDETLAERPTLYKQLRHNFPEYNPQQALDTTIAVTELDFLADLCEINNLNLRELLTSKITRAASGARSRVDVRLHNIHNLDLTGLSITAIPQSIGNLKRLKSLQIGGKKGRTRLTTLPDSIGELSNLYVLRITHARLTTLPGTIGNLRRLEHLDLTDNNLRTLPDSIGQLTQLFVLDLAHNKLTTLPGSFTKLKPAIIDLAGNPLDPKVRETLERYNMKVSY